LVVPLQGPALPILPPLQVPLPMAPSSTADQPAAMSVSPHHDAPTPSTSTEPPTHRQRTADEREEGESERERE
jgi:hypothetical protein